MVEVQQKSYEVHAVCLWKLFGKVDPNMERMDLLQETHNLKSLNFQGRLHMCCFFTNSVGFYHKCLWRWCVFPGRWMERVCSCAYIGCESKEIDIAGTVQKSGAIKNCSDLLFWFTDFCFAGTQCFFILSRWGVPCFSIQWSENPKRTAMIHQLKQPF